MVKEAHEIFEEATGRKPQAVHKLIYDSPTETLEPIYFFILDLIDDFGFKTEKLVDNFVSSPGSGHFGEMGQRSSVMQQQGSKLLGDINTVLRSIINILYDLREFKIRLEHYVGLKSGEKEKKSAALLSLKQLWMDKVDINKGNSSIKAMALGQGGFVTLIDAFLAIEDMKKIDSVDLNDMVKRILKQRYFEFETWINESEKELDKRYKIERAYLKSQVASLKTYINWAKPYLKAADELRMADRPRNPTLVKMFNTILLELTLLSKSEAKFDLPKPLVNKVPKKKYYSVMLIDYNFRGMPQRTQQGFVSGGLAEIVFRGYAVREDELDKFYKEFDNSDLEAGLELIENITENSLGELTKDINFFLDEEEKSEEEESKPKSKKGSSDQSNPFLALFGAYNDKPEKKKVAPTEKEYVLTSQEKRIEEDIIMPQINDSITEKTFTIFETYKKVHGMVSFPK